MISNRTTQDSITLDNLQPGDILSWVIIGTRHFAIYSPVAGQQGDLIHMFFNSRNECAIFKSTISQPLKNLEQGQEITVIRSRTKDEGQAIAAQAEFWLRQGVNYDFSRLGQVLYNNNRDIAEPPIEENVKQYMKYAARRATMPVKSQEFPITNINWLTKLGLFMVGSKYLCDPISSAGLSVMDYSTATPNRSRGLNCIGLVAIVVAAVKLKDHIGVVTKDTGWLSRENIQTAMTEAQLNEFSIERLSETLTPAIANTHPHLTHGDVFLKNLLDDDEHWQCMGTLDKTSNLKPFNKEAYEAETQALRTTIRDNHAQFVADFKMGIFSRKPEQLSNGKAQAEQPRLG